MGTVAINIPTLQNIVDVLDRVAPFSTAEEWDNVGMLAGSPSMPISSLLIALDLRSDVLEEAKRLGVNAIITHHPVLFHGTKNLRESDPDIKVLCDLVRSGIGLISSHTCLDRAEHGVAFSLAECLGFHETTPICDGFARLGNVKKRNCSEFAEFVRERLAVSDIQKYGSGNKNVTVCAAVPGAGGSFWRQACNAGADCLVTGEISYHDALSAVENDMCVLEVGHFFSERPVLKRLEQDLQRELNMVQYSCRIHISENTPFGV